MIPTRTRSSLIILPCLSNGTLDKSGLPCEKSSITTRSSLKKCPNSSSSNSDYASAGAELLPHAMLPSRAASAQQMTAETPALFVESPRRRCRFVRSASLLLLLAVAAYTGAVPRQGQHKHKSNSISNSWGNGRERLLLCDALETTSANNDSGKLSQEDDITERFPAQLSKLPEALKPTGICWTYLLNLGQAAAKIAVTEATELARQVARHERVQQALESLKLGTLREKFQGVGERLGLRLPLLEELRRQRERIEAAYVPILVFAQERMLENNPAVNENALMIAINDSVLKAEIKRLSDVPPARNMSAAPRLFEGVYIQLSELAQLLHGEPVFVLSLTTRIEALSSDFAQYARAALSAFSRYLSLVKRFPKNKKALFYFAQLTLPRMLKVMLLLNHLQQMMVHHVQRQKGAESMKADFSTLESYLLTPQDRPPISHDKEAATSLSQVLRRLVAESDKTAESLAAFAHGCLRAASPQFQVQFAHALDSYYHGERADVAFSPFFLEYMPASATTANLKHGLERPWDNTMLPHKLQPLCFCGDRTAHHHFESPFLPASIDAHYSQDSTSGAIFSTNRFSTGGAPSVDNLVFPADGTLAAGDVSLPDSRPSAGFGSNPDVVFGPTFAASVSAGAGVSNSGTGFPSKAAFLEKSPSNAVSASAAGGASAADESAASAAKISVLSNRADLEQQKPQQLADAAKYIESEKENWSMIQHLLRQQQQSNQHVSQDEAGNRNPRSTSPPTAITQGQQRQRKPEKHTGSRLQQPDDTVGVGDVRAWFERALGNANGNAAQRLPGVTSLRGTVHKTEAITVETAEGENGVQKQKLSEPIVHGAAQQRRKAQKQADSQRQPMLQKKAMSQQQAKSNQQQ